MEIKIPPKKEVLVYAPITPRQVELYKGILDHTILGEALKKGRSHPPPFSLALLFSTVGGCWCDGVYLSVCVDIVGGAKKKAAIPKEKKNGVLPGCNGVAELEVDRSLRKRRCTKRTEQLMK